MSAALDLVLGKLPSAKRAGSQWQAKCPAHDDRVASLTIAEGDDGRVLLKCHAGDGCPVEQIVARIGLTMADLFEGNPKGGAAPRSPPTTTRDESAVLLFQAVRLEGKKFFQRRPDGRGGWVKQAGPTRRVMFRLPEVIAAVEAGRTIYVSEGKKDVLALEAAGEVAAL